MATPQPGGGTATFNQYADQIAPKSKTNEDLSNNTEFAREMALARSGTQFSVSGKSGLKKEERRAQKPEAFRNSNGTDSPSQSTGASSTTGADADDDLSPAGSPPLAASYTASTSKSGDPSDMLEPSGAGPSILRLTDPANPIPAGKGKAANKTFEPAETKKKRQQRIKREAQRALVEEAERERRRLMEKQIRGARMAEGTSNQARTSGFKAPTENAWFSGPDHPSTETPKAVSDGSQSLLDTFETNHETLASRQAEYRSPPLSHGKVSRFEPSTSARGEEESIGRRSSGGVGTSLRSDMDWTKDLPVEEEQIRLIQDSEDSWTTVAKRDKKKSSKVNARHENDSGEVSSVDSHRGNQSSQQKGVDSARAFSESGNSYQHLGDSGFHDSGFHDSDWAA